MKHDEEEKEIIEAYEKGKMKLSIPSEIELEAIKSAAKKTLCLFAIRKTRAADAVVSLQCRSVERGTDGITMEEIDTEIKSVRKKPKR